MPTATELLRRVISGSELGFHEMEEVVGRLMDGELRPELQAGLLTALATRGESVEEIAGAASAMRRRVVRLPGDADGLVDTCGTGGDGKGTFNISTAAALIAAAAGVPIAKHGNRSVSSRSGSADVLAELGVELDMEPERAARCLREIGITFLFAPRYHPAMRVVAPVRRALGVRTLFNVLGPLTNPAGARRQVIGVYAEPLVETVARVLVRLECEHALVVHGADGLDEISTTGPTRVAEVRDGRVRIGQVDPEGMGVALARLRDLAAGDARANAAAMRELFAGRRGPLYDIAAVNAGAAIWVGGLAGDLAEGAELARRAIDSGAALAKLEALGRFSNDGSGSV